MVQLSDCRHGVLVWLGGFQQHDQQITRNKFDIVDGFMRDCEIGHYSIHKELN